MKLSHIHEDKEYRGSLADWLNRFNEWAESYLRTKLMINVGSAEAAMSGDYGDAEYSLVPRGSRQAKALSGGIGGIESAHVAEIKIAKEQTPETENPLDNIRDEFADSLPVYVTMVKGNGKFEGQFAWYNEDWNTDKQILPDDKQPAPTVSGHFSGKKEDWIDGKPPSKLPANWQGRA